MLHASTTRQDKRERAAFPVMHCRRWRKQRSQSRACNVSNAPLATVGAVGLMWVVEDRCMYAEYKVLSSAQMRIEKESRTRRLSRLSQRARARARLRGHRMEFTSTNSIFVWEKARSSAWSSMHAPRGSTSRKMRGIARLRAARCYRGKNRAALKERYPPDSKGREISRILVLSFSLFLARYSTRPLSCPRFLLEISRMTPRGTGDDEI